MCQTTVRRSLVFLVFIVLGLIWCSGRESSKKCSLQDTIQVGTNAEFAPFSFIKDGAIVGFDIDVINEVARRLNKQIKLVDMPFTALLSQLQLGSVHVIAAGISPTPQRAQHVFFTQPYLTGDPLLIITRKEHDPLTQMRDLYGKEVVVNDGYTAEGYLALYPDIKLLRLATPAQAFLALTSSRAQAYVTAASSVQRFFELPVGRDFMAYPLEGFQETYALAVSRTCPELYASIEQAVAAMIHDGTMAALQKRWGLS